MPITKIEEGGQGIPYDSKTGEEFPVSQQTVSNPKSNTTYQKGYEEGYSKGFKDGYDNGFSDAKNEFLVKNQKQNVLWEIFGEITNNEGTGGTFLVSSDTFDNAVKKFKEVKKGYSILSIRMLNNIIS